MRRREARRRQQVPGDGDGDRAPVNAHRPGRQVGRDSTRFVDNFGCCGERRIERDNHDSVKLDIRPAGKRPGREMPASVDSPDVDRRPRLDCPCVGSRKCEIPVLPRAWRLLSPHSARPTSGLCTRCRNEGPSSQFPWHADLHARLALRHHDRRWPVDRIGRRPRQERPPFERLNPDRCSPFFFECSRLVDPFFRLSRMDHFLFANDRVRRRQTYDVRKRASERTSESWLLARWMCISLEPSRGDHRLHKNGRVGTGDHLCEMCEPPVFSPSSFVGSPE